MLNNFSKNVKSQTLMRSYGDNGTTVFTKHYYFLSPYFDIENIENKSKAIKIAVYLNVIWNVTRNVSVKSTDTHQFLCLCLRSYFYYRIVPPGTILLEYWESANVSKLISRRLLRLFDRSVNTFTALSGNSWSNYLRLFSIRFYKDRSSFFIWNL